jgi:hypothetical protein
MTATRPPNFNGFETHEYTPSCKHTMKIEIFAESKEDLRHVLDVLENFPCRKCREKLMQEIKPFTEDK